MANGGPGPKVTIRSVLNRNKSGRTFPSPWVVKWRVGASDRSRVFADKTAATVFHARLVSARAEGLRFDLKSGLPELWASSDDVVAVFAKQWFEEQRPSWSPRSRRNASDVLVPALICLVRARAPQPPDMPALRREVRDWLAGPANAEPPTFLRRWSLPLSEIDEDVAKQAAQVVYRKQDGTPVASSSQHRIRTVMRAMFTAAVDRRKIVKQPWPGATARKADRLTTQVNVRALPNQAEALAVIAGQRGPNFQVLGYLCFYAGLRPSEATALTVDRCTLPDEGWGSLRIEQAVQDIGPTWTEAGEEIGEPKTHARTVPIPPQLVAILRTHIGERTDGLVVPTRNGTPVQPSNWGKAWREAVRAHHKTWVVYDLRHACATIWLRCVPIGECARRLGHSPEVLLSTYAGVLTGDEDIANQRIEEALTNE